MGQDGPASGDRGHCRRAGGVGCLRALASGREASISFGDLLAAAGARVHGLAFSCWSCPRPCLFRCRARRPFLASPLMLVSLHLALFGERQRVAGPAERLSRPPLDGRGHRPLPRRRFLQWLEAMSRPRWAASGPARKPYRPGLPLSVGDPVFLPIPLLNTPPAICLALIALGLIQRDGLHHRAWPRRHARNDSRLGVAGGLGRRPGLSVT